MNRTTYELRNAISDFDALRHDEMMGGDELMRALNAALNLIEDLQQRVTELEAQPSGMPGFDSLAPDSSGLDEPWDDDEHDQSDDEISYDDFTANDGRAG